MKSICFTLVYLLTTAISWGRTAGTTDSTRVYNAQDMIVTATRTSILQHDSPSPVDVLTTRDIQRSNGSSVVDVLRSSEGVFLKDYGPTASLKTISFRGLSADHILVLYDGTRLNNFQNGLVDFSLLPMNNIDRIEVVRGGNSALYGADALGGVINIISSRPTETVNLHADASYGSYEYKKLSFDARGRIQGIGLVFGVMHDQAMGNYPFLLHRPGLSDTTQKREGADFTRTQMYLNSDYSFDERSSLAFSLQRVKSNQGAPGSLTYFSDMRQDDDAVTSVASFHDQHIDGLTLNVNMGWTYDLQKYYSKTKTTLASFNPQVEWIVSSWDRVIVGGEYVEGHLDGMLPDAEIKRIQRSLYISNEMVFQSKAEYLDRVSLYQSVRYDAISEGQDAYSPKVGFNIRLMREWDTRLRASFGKNFRMPTFNDLYDPWLGNPALTPEHSESFDCGGETSLDRAGRHSVQLTYFDIITRDRIFPNAYYFPVNIPRAQSTGIECRYDFRSASNELDAYADVTFNTSSRQSSDSTNGKQLLYIPKVNCVFGVSAMIADMNLSVTEMYTSSRFITENESAWLPEYWITDMNLSTVVRWNPVRLNLRAEVSNLFDTQYQVLPGYPMPGRTFRFTIGCDY